MPLSQMIGIGIVAAYAVMYVFIIIAVGKEWVK